MALESSIGDSAAHPAKERQINEDKNERIYNLLWIEVMGIKLKFMEERTPF
jgi:hypothetical protein